MNVEYKKNADNLGNYKNKESNPGNSILENDAEYDSNSKIYETENLILVPLGGTCEIGMNFNVYGLNGKWLIVDCGTGFAEDMPGVTMIVPDISFIKNKKKDIVGMVLTHSHEDHIGAVQHLWKNIGCPIYATKFTANFLKARLQEFNLPNIEIKEVQTGKLSLSPFELELINMTHSVPEMHSIAIKTQHGVVLHSGDWKFDQDPVVGELSNEKRLEELGDEGVCAIVCDSTNVFSEGISGSEGSVYAHIKEVAEESTGILAVTLFASNIARIHTISKIAKEVGKKVVVLGRSLNRSIYAAQESGYLTEYEFLKPSEGIELERNEVLLLCTGCQGDRLAATNKLSLGSHPVFKMKEGDTILMSSKMIPGNEKKIISILNRFVLMGVNIITEKTHMVHVSGHPYRDELKKMYKITRPRSIVPVHGEPLHIQEHVKLAADCGVEGSIFMQNGDMIEFTEDGVKKIDSIETGFLAVDGKLLCHPKNIVMNQRKRMQDNGMIIIVLLFDRRHNELFKRPTVLCPGFNSDPRLAERVSRNIEELMFSPRFANTRRLHTGTVVKAVRSETIRCITFTGKTPLIEIHVEYI